MPNRVILFDTRDAKRLTDTNEVEFSFDSLLTPINNRTINYVAVVGAEIPNVMYNIRTGRNDILSYEVKTGGIIDHTGLATIPEGYYTTATLITALTTALTGGGFTHTVSISALTGKITIVQDQGNDFRFVFSTSTVGRVIGFLTDTAQAVSVVGQRPIDLRGVTSVLIGSNQQIEGIASFGTGHSQYFLHEVKIDQPFGSTVFQQVETPILLETSRITNPIRFSLKNRNLENIDINLFDWKLSLLVNFE